MNKAYLQLGNKDQLPMQTVSCDIKEKPLWFHDRGLMQTASGYGSKLASRYMIRLNNKWHRVYSICYSNVSTEYILINKVKHIVQLED